MKRYKEKEYDAITFAKGQVWRSTSHPATYRLIDAIWTDNARNNELRIMSRYVDPNGDHIWPMVLHDVSILTSNFYLDPKGLE